MRKCLAATLAVLLGTLGCEPAVVSQSELFTTRVLAIRADPPELVVPADGGLPPPVHFTVLSFSPDGGAPSVALALCVAGNPYGADSGCPGENGIPLPDDTLDVANPQIAGLLLALDGGIPQSGLPPTEPGVLQVAIGYCATTRGTAPEDCTPAGSGLSGDTEWGVYRLGVRFSGRPNHNPQLLSVSLTDGGSLAGALLPYGQSVTLTPAIPDGGLDASWPSVGIDGGVETYLGLDGGTFYEDLFFSWYATAPNVANFFSNEATPSDTAETPFNQFTGAYPGPVTFYVVLRDGRGGTDWLVLDAGVLP